MTTDDKALIDFFYEVGQLKRQPRSGWLLLGITQPESVADHTCRAVFIAYALAKLEGANPDKAALIAAFHELPETRTGDLHKMAAHYFPQKKAVEKQVVADQLKALPPELAKEFASFFNGFDNEATPEHTIAKDADYLEVILQAKEYLDQGYAGAENWITNATKCLTTKTAQRLAKRIAVSRSTEWYEGIKKIER